MAQQHEKAIDLLPVQVQPGMKASCRLYLSIGASVRERLKQGDVLAKAYTTRWQKFKVLLSLTFR